MKYPALASLCVTALALSLSACGGGDGTTDPVATPAPSPAPAPAPTPSPSPAPAPTPSPSPTPAPAPSPAPAPAPTPAPSPAPAPSAGAASECFNMAWYTPGTTYVLDYAITGSATGSTRSNGSVSGGKTYNGQSGLLEFFQDQTTTYTAPAALASAGAVPTQSRFYFSENGSVINEYGGTAAVNTTVAGIAITSTTTVTYNPAKVNRRFTLAAGASSASSTTVNSVTTTNFGGAPASNTAETITVTYVGQESVTVPAGTFTACKFTLRDQAGADNTEWYGKGSGAPLKLTSKASDGTSVVLSLTAATRLNGAPL